MKIKPFAGVRPPKEIASEVASRPYDVLNSVEAKAEAAPASGAPEPDAAPNAPQETAEDDEFIDDTPEGLEDGDDELDDDEIDDEDLDDEDDDDLDDEDDEEEEDEDDE